MQRVQKVHGLLNLNPPNLVGCFDLDLEQLTQVSSPRQHGRWNCTGEAWGCLGLGLAQTPHAPPVQFH